MRARVDASSPAAESALHDLATLAVSFGAELHPGSWLSESAGHMSIHANAPDGEMLIRLPERLLIPMDTAVWDVVGNDLSIVQHDDAATSRQRELAEALVRIYNVTRKIGWATVGLPQVALQGVPGAVDVVRSLRPDFVDRSSSIADAFVQTRVLRWSVGSGRGDDHEGRFLMPVVDLANHHERGAPWGRVAGSLSIVVTHPTGDSECMVRYRARQDPLDAALSYGFVDSSCTLARSRPVTVDVGGLGVVEVAARHLRTRSALDPPSIAIEKDRLRLSHVTFDANHPNRLSSVLRLAVAAFIAKRSPTLGTDPATATSALIEALMSSNLVGLKNARSDLERMSADSPAVATVVLAIDEQERIIRRFRNTFRSIPQV